MKKVITCIVCPIGCDISVDYQKTHLNGIKVIEVEGNVCAKGKEFVIKEMENPERTITSSIKIENGELPLISVRTSKPVPKSKIFEIINIINTIIVKAPIRCNDVIVENILDLGVNIISTRSVKLKQL